MLRRKHKSPADLNLPGYTANIANSKQCLRLYFFKNVPKAIKLFEGYKEMVIYPSVKVFNISLKDRSLSIGLESMFFSFTYMAQRYFYAKTRIFHAIYTFSLYKNIQRVAFSISCCIYI